MRDKRSLLHRANPNSTLLFFRAAASDLPAGHYFGVDATVASAFDRSLTAGADAQVRVRAECGQGRRILNRSEADRSASSG